MADCGTYAGAMGHKRRLEPLDEACKRAVAAYAKERRATNPDARARDRWWNSTRGRALELLAAEYPKRFNELLIEVRKETDPS